MDILFENVSPADATTYTRAWANRLDTDPTTGPSLAQFLPNRTISGLKSRMTRASRVQTKARFRAFDAPTPVGQRPVAITVSEVSLAPLGQALPLREQEILLKAQGDGRWDEVVDAVYDDMRNNATAIHNLIEALRAEFLFTGALSINDNGFIQEADFGLAADHNLDLATVGTAWDDVTIDSIDQEQEWVNKVQQDADAPVVAAVTSQRVLNALMKQEVYRNPTALVVNRSRTAFNAARVEAGLPPIYTYEKAVDGARLTPDNKIAYVTGSVGETQWGDTAEALELFGSNAIDESNVDQPAIASAAWRTKNPVNVWSQSNATALPVAGDINGLFVAEVLAEA